MHPSSIYCYVWVFGDSFNIGTDLSLWYTFLTDQMRQVVFNISWVFINENIWEPQMILVDKDIMRYGLIVCKWIVDEKLF